MFLQLKVIKYLFLCVIAYQIHLKVTEILRTCCKKFVNFNPATELFYYWKNRALILSGNTDFLSSYSIITCAQVEYETVNFF